MGRAATTNRPRRRRRRTAAGTGAIADVPDGLSNLPDDVLLAIASHLPTRQAVSLSALARRFRHLPTRFRRLDSVSISKPDLPLPLRPAPPLLIRRLALSPHRAFPPPPPAFRRVLDTAAGHGVSELAVRLQRSACLPRNVLSIRSLAVLSLDKCAVPHGSAVECARLRTLKLHRVSVHQEIITAVLTAALGLETLEMVYCSGFGTGIGCGCTVDSMTVRNFLFRPALEQRETTIRATGLRTVTLYTRPKTLRVQLAPAAEVRKAYLHVAKPRGNLEFRIRPFLDAGLGLACLTLRGLATKFLSSEYEEIPELDVTFQDLRILSVSLDFSGESEYIFLLKLLASCPSLQQLTISAAESNRENASLRFADHEERLEKISCLTNSLVQFNFLGFGLLKHQKELIIFLLNHTKKLKRMGVQFPENKEPAVRKILSEKRAPIERRSTLYNHCHLELEYS